MTTCNKAQANTSRPEEARLRLPDPGHNLPRDGEPLASPFLGFFLSVKTGRFFIYQWIGSAPIRSIMGFLARRKVLWHGRPAQLDRSVGSPNRWWDSRSIWSNFENSFSLFRTVELSIKMFSPPPFGLSLESELLCVGRLSTQSNSLPIGRQ